MRALFILPFVCSVYVIHDPAEAPGMGHFFGQELGVEEALALDTADCCVKRIGAATIQGVTGLHSLIGDHEHGGCDDEGKRSKELLFPRRGLHEGKQVHATRGVFGYESLGNHCLPIISHRQNNRDVPGCIAKGLQQPWEQGGNVCGTEVESSNIFAKAVISSPYTTCRAFARGCRWWELPPVPLPGLRSRSAKPRG